jgi:hypothetical protein
MDKQKKEKISKYGKLVCDFANAQTTDDVLISFFDNLQSAFKFSKSFTKKALKQFPTKKIITEKLTVKEKELLEILWQRNKALKSCNTATNHLYFDTDKYYPINSTFQFIQKTYYTGIPDPKQDYFPLDISISEKEIEAYIEERIEYHREYFDIEDTFKKNLLNKLNKLAKLYHQVEDMKSGATKRFLKIEKMAGTYLENYLLHDYVRENQEFLKSILSQIIKLDDAYKTDAFKDILELYNKIEQKTYIDKQKNQIMKEDAFIESNYFDYAASFVLEKIFKLPVSYCLVELLKEKENIGKIKNCNKCNKYFIEIRKGRKQYCTDKCRLDYHNRIRIDSGEHAAYVSKKRKEGAKPSYY